MSVSTSFNYKRIQDNVIQVSSYSIEAKEISCKYDLKIFHPLFSKEGKCVTEDELAKEYLGERYKLRRIVENLPQHQANEIMHSNAWKIHNSFNLCPFLWAAQKDSNAVYLIGTYHKGLSNSKLHKIIESVIKTSKILYLEISLFSIKNDEEMKILLKDREEEMKRWEELGLKFSLETEELEQLPLKSDSKDQEVLDKFSDDFGCEIKMEEFAQNKSIEIRSLEKFTGRWKKDAEAYENEKGHFYFTEEFELESLDAFQAGNLKGLEKLEKLQPSILKRELAKRNKKMADQIAKKLQKGERAVFAVGCGHFPGDRGILKLLEKKGIKITRVLY